MKYRPLTLFSDLALGLTKMVCVSAHPVDMVNNCAKLCENLYKDFVCVEVLWPSQPYGVMSSMVSLPKRTFTGQA